jgi:cytochrome oxidase assembly protein ShyY1
VAAGTADIVGALRWPEAGSAFAGSFAAGESDGDPAAMVAGDGRPGAPVLHRAGAPVPPGGLPHPAPLKVQLRNDHLQYPVTGPGSRPC